MNFDNPFKFGLFRNIIFLEVLFFFFMFIFYFIFGYNGEGLPQNINNYFMIILSDVSTLGILYFIIKKYQIKLKYFFKKEKISIQSFGAETKTIYLFIPLLYLLGYGLRVNGYYTPDETDNFLKLIDITNKNFLFQNLLVIFSTCIFAPITEEILFRGILLHRLSVKWNLKKGIIISSLFFGILHDFSFIQISVLGIIFCLIYLKTNNLYYTIFAHATYNFVVLTSDYISTFYGLEYIESLSVMSMILVKLGVGLTVPFLIYKLVKLIEKSFPQSIAINNLPYFINLKNNFDNLNIVFEDEKVKEKYFTLKRIMLFLASLIIVGILSLGSLEYYLLQTLSYPFKEIQKISDSQINTNNQGSQKNPSVAINAAKGFFVWQSENQDGDKWGIYLKSFDISKKLGKELQVNQMTKGDQYNPYISYVSEDKFLIVWQSKQNEKISIVGRFINAQGKYLGNEFIIDYTNNEKAKPIILSDIKSCSCLYYVMWKDTKTRSVILKQYDMASLKTKDFKINISPSIKYENIKFVLDNKDILMTGKEANKIFLYKVNLLKGNTEKLLEVSDTGFNPNIYKGDKSIVTISWEDASQDKEKYQIKAKNYKTNFNYQQQKIKTDIIKESKSRYKDPSSVYINNLNISLWQNKDISINKWATLFVFKMFLNDLDIISDEGIFINNNLTLMEDNETQINKVGSNQQENYSFDYFSTGDTGYITIVWQSKEQDGNDWGIFADTLVIEGNDISSGW